LNVLDRYAQELREQNSRLMLSEVSNEVIDNFVRTGYMDIFGRDNIFRGTERVFEATLEAQYQAKKWIAEQKKSPTTDES
jgi:uncharacterized protein (DUF924 family)